MKAKDYADKFPGYMEEYKDEYPDQDELVIRCAMQICVDMLDEMDEIRKKRHITTNGAYVSVIDEMRMKWKAIVSRLNQPLIQDDFFDYFMEQYLPQTWGFKKKVDAAIAERRGRISRYGSGRY